HRPAPLASADIDQLVGAVVGPAGPSGRTATFSAREVTQAVAGRVGDRADAATVDRLTARVLADPRLVQVDVQAVRRRRDPEPVYTTYDLLEVEDSLLALCRAGRTAHSGHSHRLLSPGHLDTALAPFTAAARRAGADHAAPNGADALDSRADGADTLVLSGEQVDAVHRLLDSTDLVRVLVGPAGSGKTEAMRLAVWVLTDAGRRVVAGAHGGRQTEQLTARLGVEGRVVAGWLTLLDATPDPRQVWPAGTVLILDEATHVQTRDAERLLRYATTTGTVVIAVGDPAQLGSIGPGGWFTHLATTLPEHDVVALSAVHRQTGPGMAGVRAALAGLRAGAPPQIRAALARLADDNRIRLFDTRPAMLAAVVTDWHTDRTNSARADGRAEGGATSAGSRAGGAHNGARRASGAPGRADDDGDGDDPVGGEGLTDLPRMTAADHTTVEWLNRAAQLRLIATGRLDPTAFVEVAGRRFHVGDEVLTLTQAGHTLIPAGRPPSGYLRTGTIGVVTALHVDPSRPDAQAVTVTFPGKGQVQVGWGYLTHRFSDGRDGGLALAYAITAHKAQGTTMTSARPVVTDRTSRAGLYVMLSRAATDLTAYLIDSSTLHGGLDDEDWLPILDADTDTLDRLGASLEASRPDRLVAVALADARAVADLRRPHTLAELPALRRRI
ncbi:MAG: AAA family ATPase, partial [Frankia sp.]